MKKKILISVVIVIILVSIPVYYYWPYIRFYFGFHIVRSPEGARFAVNQISLSLTEGTTRQDAEELARLVDGRIVGEIPSVQQYLIEVPSRTIDEFDALILRLKNLNDPRIGNVRPNYTVELIQ